MKLKFHPDQTSLSPLYVRAIINLPMVLLRRKKITESKTFGLCEFWLFLPVLGLSDSLLSFQVFRLGRSEIWPQCVWELLEAYVHVTALLIATRQTAVRSTRCTKPQNMAGLSRGSRFLMTHGVRAQQHTNSSGPARDSNTGTPEHYRSLYDTKSRH